MDTKRSVIAAAGAAVAFVAGIALAPVAARAAGQLVTIVSPDDSSQANVVKGALVVGDGDGPLTVDGTLTVGGIVGIKSAKAIPVREAPRAYQSTGSGIIHNGRHTQRPTFAPVPAGTRLMVQNISLEGDGNFDRGMLRCYLGGHFIQTALERVTNTSDQSLIRHSYYVNLPTTAFVNDGGLIQCNAGPVDEGGRHFQYNVSIAGVLIPA